MMMNYTLLDQPRDKEWMLAVKKFSDIKSVHKIGLDAVFHDLIHGYLTSGGDGGTTIEEDAQSTFWSDNRLYSYEDVEKLFINDEYYVFSHMYITEQDHMILVVVKVSDIWAEDSEISEEAENAEPIYFLVEY